MSFIDTTSKIVGVNTFGNGYAFYQAVSKEEKQPVIQASKQMRDMLLNDKEFSNESILPLARKIMEERFDKPSSKKAGLTVRYDIRPMVDRSGLNAGDIVSSALDMFLEDMNKRPKRLLGLKTNSHSRMQHAMKCEKIMLRAVRVGSEKSFGKIKSDFRRVVGRFIGDYYGFGPEIEDMRKDKIHVEHRMIHLKKSLLDEVFQLSCYYGFRNSCALVQHILYTYEDSLNELIDIYNDRFGIQPKKISKLNLS